MNGGTEPEAASKDESVIEGGVGDGGVKEGQEGVEVGEAAEVGGGPRTSIENAGAAGDGDGGEGEGEGEGGGEEDANSEAETVLTSPVKKRRQQQGVDVKVEEAAVEKGGDGDDGQDEDDEEADAPGSPDDTLVVDAATAKPNEAAQSDNEDESALSDISPTRSSVSAQSSRASSRSRAASEMPEMARNGNRSPNPKKRKHRASSVSLPNKRQSMDVAKRRLRGMYSEDGVGKHPGDRSPSPKGRNHRRAVSTQSAFLDGSSETQSGRKRRGMSQFPIRDAKPTRSGWDESSISSEATSHGQSDQKRPQRGVGRSTSTPGRPAGRAHKPHTNKYGFTKLAEACEAGDLDLVKEWREKEPDQLELAEYAGNTPLQIAALNGNVEVVEYLIGQGCHVDCANVDRDTPLLDAAENGHLDVVEVLLKAGVDPLRQNRKGQQALDVVSDDTENAAEIKSTLLNAIAEWNSNDAKQRREEEEEQRYRAGPQKELHFMARTYENLLKLVTNNDRGAVREFLDAHVPVDNVIIAAAARTGDSYLVNMLLAEMTDKKASQKPEKPMNSVLGSSHFEMVKQLTELDHFNPLYRDRSKRSWPEIAEQKRGPMWKQEVELLQRLYDEASRKMVRRSSSPVTKRDHAQRRPPLKSTDNTDEDEDDEDEDEEEAPKRKNGRRLMSRRDMLAAQSGKHGSELSSEDDEGEDESEDEAKEVVAKKEMKPPESPQTRRGVGRPRTKSLSAQPPAEVPETRTRSRRSSSLRGKPEPVLPSVDESMEDVLADAEDDADADADAEGEVEESAMTAEVPDATAVDEEQERQEEEAAKAREAEEAAAKKAEAEAKAEEERKAQEARDAEEAARAEEERKAQEARDAEAARKAEERQQREAELAEQKRQRRQDLIAALPPALAHLLDPTAVNAPGYVDIVLENFTPLQAVAFPSSAVEGSSGGGAGAELYVLNVQVAPLLGEKGLDFLLSSSSSSASSSTPEDPPSTSAFDSAEASRWITLEFAEADKAALPLILPAHLLTPSALQPDVGTDAMDVDLDSLTFAQELERAASRVSSALQAQSKLLAAAAPLQLRWVRLADVHAHVRLEFKGAVEEVMVRRDWRRDGDVRAVRKGMDVENVQGFVERVGRWWEEGASGVTGCRVVVGGK